MKKAYIKPVGQIIAMRVNENIAASVGSGDNGIDFELQYRYGANGTKYIAFSNIVASNTGNPEIDRYMDIITSAINGLHSICGDPMGGISPH